jgi:hypothetical protein
MTEDLASHLAVLAGQIDVCRDQIDRAPHGDLRDAALPKLRSAHCLLRGLSVDAARDTLLLDDLAPALDTLFGQIDACCDLVDHATHNV